MDAANVIALVVSVLALLAAAWSAVESWRLRQIEKGRDERQDLHGDGFDAAAGGGARSAWLKSHRASSFPAGRPLVIPRRRAEA